MSCGDSFFYRGRFLVLSLCLHAAILFSSDFDRSTLLAASTATIQVSLPSLAKTPTTQRLVSDRASISKRPAKKPAPSSDLAKTPSFSRSTAVFTKKPTSQPLVLAEGADIGAVSLEAMDVARYRLALARQATGLLTASQRGIEATGELAFELVRQKGSTQSTVKMHSSAVDQALTKDLLALMQMAVDQTVMPSIWAGRALRIPLSLQIEGAQRQARSG